MYVGIREIGRAAGATVQAERLVQNIRSRLDAIQGQAQGARKPSVLLLVGKDPGRLTNMIGVGPTAYLGELLEIAGGRNILADSNLIPYPRISLETVVRLDPDLILDASGMGDLKQDVQMMQERMREPWLQHRELSAVRNGRVVAITSEALVVPGPRVVDAVELMRKPIRESERAMSALMEVRDVGFRYGSRVILKSVQLTAATRRIPGAARAERSREEHAPGYSSRVFASRVQDRSSWMGGICRNCPRATDPIGSAICRRESGMSFPSPWSRLS